MGNILTFYSYKGGVGRSFLLANAAALLSTWGYKTLCIDWDLEAPGLHDYFNPWFSEAPSQGLLDYVEEVQFKGTADWREYVTELKLPKARSSLSLMVAGRQDDSYTDRVQKLNWESLYEQHNFGETLEALRENWKKEFDVILVDSRTGITDIGGICTIQLPDVLVFVFTANHQSLNGAITIVNRAKKHRQLLPTDRANLLAVPIISRFDMREEKERSEKWMQIIHKKVAPMMSGWCDRSISSLDLLYKLILPYFSYWSYGEELPVITERREDPESINYYFNTLTSLIAHDITGSGSLVSSRDTYLSLARRRPSPPDIRIIPPADRESCYSYKITHAGLTRRAYLTYELSPKKLNNRTVLLVQDSGSLVPEEYREEYNRLSELLFGSATSRFQQVKSLVNQVHEGHPALPHVKVVVHRFGPVPVLLLPDTYSIENLGNELKVQVGIMPNVATGRSRRDTSPPFTNNKQDYLLSLTTGLDVMFKCYFEDVGEGMFDIENYLGLADVFGRARDIEEILGGSINTKLHMVNPSKEVLRNPQGAEQLVGVDLFLKEADWLLTATYARQFALYFLNELYRHIGVRDQSVHYFDSLQRIGDDFNIRMGEQFYQEACERIEPLSTLNNALQAYWEQDYERLDEIQSETFWVGRFLGFARFVATLNRFEIPPMAGRIFLSYSHEFALAELISREMARRASVTLSSSVRILNTTEYPISRRLRKSALWSSDLVVGIIGKHELESDREGKSESWIATELQQALVLGKRLSLLIEEGQDVRTLFRFAVDANPLSPVTQPLSKKLIDTLDHIVLPAFSQNLQLNPRFMEVLAKFGDSTLKARHQAILVGFLKQFPAPVGRVIWQIEKIAPYPKNLAKENLAAHLSKSYPKTYKDTKKAETAIVNAWRAAKSRQLVIDGEAVSLLRLTGDRRYSGNMGYILRRLRPDLDATEIENWKSDVLRSLQDVRSTTN